MFRWGVVFNWVLVALCLDGVLVALCLDGVLCLMGCWWRCV